MSVSECKNRVFVLIDLIYEFHITAEYHRETALFL